MVHILHILQSKYPWFAALGAGFSTWMSLNYHWVSGLVITLVTVLIMIVKFKREERRKDRMAFLNEERLKQKIRRESA